MITKENRLKEGVQEISDLYQDVMDVTGQMIVGNSEMIELITIAVLTGGHILIEGVPGTAKTTVSKIMARLFGYDFTRVQGAVDVQPADIMGVRIYDRDKKEFILHKGPIFTNFILVDEINRLTPRTQSAFIEALAESQVTIDGVTFRLPDPYLAIATQNPFEFEGTFPLIEAQKDRFDYSLILNHLNAEEELDLIRRGHTGRLGMDTSSDNLRPVADRNLILRAGQTIRKLHTEEAIVRYVRDIIIATREHPDLKLGASSRGSLSLILGAKAHAALRNRTYVLPDDVKAMACPALRYRIILEKEAEIGRLSPDEIISEILDHIEVP